MYCFKYSIAVSESQLWYTFPWGVSRISIYLLMLICMSLLSVRPGLVLQSPFGLLRLILVVEAVVK